MCGKSWLRGGREKGHGKKFSLIGPNYSSSVMMKNVFAVFGVFVLVCVCVVDGATPPPSSATDLPVTAAILVANDNLVYGLATCGGFESPTFSTQASSSGSTLNLQVVMNGTSTWLYYGKSEVIVETVMRKRLDTADGVIETVTGPGWEYKRWLLARMATSTPTYYGWGYTSEPKDISARVFGTSTDTVVYTSSTPDVAIIDVAIDESAGLVFWIEGPSSKFDSTGAARIMMAEFPTFNNPTLVSSGYKRLDALVVGPAHVFVAATDYESFSVGPNTRVLMFAKPTTPASASVVTAWAFQYTVLGAMTYSPGSNEVYVAFQYNDAISGASTSGVGVGAGDGTGCARFLVSSVGATFESDPNDAAVAVIDSRNSSPCTTLSCVPTGPGSSAAGLVVGWGWMVGVVASLVIVLFTF